MKSEGCNQKIKAEIERRITICSIELASRSFWQFCLLIDPIFYKQERIYLFELCNTLEMIYKKQLILPNGKIAKNLIIQMPPRHGKTRTLVLFSAWVFGQDPKFKILSAAFDDDLAQDFSRYTRDTIAQERNDEEIIYRDIFPKTEIKHGQASYQKWALVGSHFSYKGAGVGGSITGKGGNMLLIDDPVKDANIAYNDNMLDKLWLWYTSTWFSRQEASAINVITHTPWSKKDICGRILSGEEKEDWYVFSRSALQDNGEMLCDGVLSIDDYKKIERVMDPLIFQANYCMNRIDKKGLMYREFTTYKKLPDFEHEYDHQGKVMITDTAGKGKDFLCSIYGYITGEFFYVFDVDYTQEDIDITEEIAAEKLINYKINTADIESNSAGHSWAFHVEKILKEKHKWFGTTFLEKNQSQNKESRIFTHHREVNRRIIFPYNWREMWPQFYSAVMTFSKLGQNKNDDAPDTLTRVIEHLNVNTIVLPT